MGSSFNTSNIKYLSMDEFDELINAVEKVDHSSKFYMRNRTIFLVAEYCGLRASEIGLIELTDVNFKEKSIFCRRLKGSVSNVLKIIDDRVYDVGRQIVTGGNCTLKSITLPVTACISGTDGNLCQVQLHVIAALFQLNELKFN